MIDGILIGLATALTFQNILMVMIGCFFGTIIGMLPGLGPMTAIAPAPHHHRGDEPGCDGPSNLDPGQGVPGPVHGEGAAVLRRTRGGGLACAPT